MLQELLRTICSGKSGLEIGGPSSSTGGEIYKHALNLDNVIFSNNTVWSQHTSEYNFFEGKKGNVIINDAVDIKDVKTGTYDFIFSSHCLEHIANPMKAVKEWLRVTKRNGYLIIIVPEKSGCFDHKRNVSSFQTLLNQYEKDVGEDDLSTLPEILKNHDLAMDPPAGDLGHFTKRSLDNFNNRCLHHYVYSPLLVKEVTSYFNSEFVYTVTQGLNIWCIIKKTEE